MQTIATFSIVARDPVTLELGIAVQSKFLAVGAVVPWAKAGVGAIATQAYANLDYGEIGLKLLEKGYSAEAALQALLALDPGREDRQVGIVDAQGGSVSFTGSKCYDWAGGLYGENFACQGNILVNEATVTAMAAIFESAEGTLARRLVKALSAAQEAGGDSRGRQSASLLVVRENGSYGGYNDRAVDLRVDDDPEPIEKLEHLLTLHEMYFEVPTRQEHLEVTLEIAETLHMALNRLGYLTGEFQGAYNQTLKVAFAEFCGKENFEARMLPGDIVDRKVFEYLKEKAAAL
jgi:uncharacterized Ntn-hydrolase superfamily protein